MLNFVPNLIPIGSQSHVLITVIKKRISEAGGGEFLDSSITFPAGYYGKHINIFNEKLTSSLFSLEFDLENFIFSLKYHQRKVDRNTSKKSIVFVTILHRNFHLYVQLSYTKISYLPKNTHLRKDAGVLHFCLKESLENMIFPWNGNIQKPTKRWSFLSFSQNFLEENSFFHAVRNFSKNRHIFKKMWHNTSFWKSF